jgi:outer membrane usher protein
VPRALFLFLLLATAASASDERAFLRVQVNGAEHGDILVVLREGDVLCRPRDLEASGLRDLGGAREQREGEEWLSLKSLAPGVRFRVDAVSTSLVLVAETEHLPRTRLDLSARTRPADLVISSVPSAFANYSVQLSNGPVPAGFFEAGASAGPLLLVSALSASRAQGVVRGLSTLTWDDPSSLRRLTFGDAFAIAGPLGGALPLGGISLTREFALDPYFISTPTMQLSGVTTTPSRMEIYVDGRLTREEALAPGAFELANLPGYGTGASTRIVVRDAFGRAQEFTGTLRSGAGLLAPGLTEYAAQLGFRRLDFATRSFSYGEPVLLTRGRLGLYDGLTSGGRLEAGLGFASFGPNLTVGLPNGALDLAGAASVSGQKTGSAASATWSLSTRFAGLGAQMIWNSPAYANASLAPEQDRALLQLRLTASTSLGSRVSLTAGAAQGRMRDAGRSQSLFGNATVRLAAPVSLIASANLDRSASVSTPTLFVGLNFALGPSSQASFSGQRTGSATLAAVDLQKATPPGTGVAWHLHGQSDNGGRADGDVQLFGEHAISELRYGQSPSHGDWMASVSGALVAIGGGVYASRPIQDSYALIQVPGVEGVRGELEHQEIGRTNHRGDLLVPRLLPYYGNHVGINAIDIPFDRSLGTTQRLIGTPIRAGTLVRFEAPEVQAWLGSLRVVWGGESIVPAAGDLLLRRGDEPARFPLGADGAFYLEGIGGGLWHATLLFDGERCSFELTLPQHSSGQILKDLGVLSCTMLVARRAPPSGTISGRLFLDRNGNGAWDRGEPALTGVRIRSGGQEGTTDGEGRFAILGVPAGTVEVRFAREDVPAGYELAAIPVVHLEAGADTIADLHLRAPRPPKRQGDALRVALRDGRSDLFDLFGLTLRPPLHEDSLFLPQPLGAIDVAPDIRLLIVGRGSDFRAAVDLARGKARLLARRGSSSRIVWTVEESTGRPSVDLTLVRVRGLDGWASNAAAPAPVVPSIRRAAPLAEPATPAAARVAPAR